MTGEQWTMIKNFSYLCARMNAYLNIKGHLHDLSRPQVMGIINVTPDSFYPSSRVAGEDALRRRVEQIRDEGATMVDVGAVSTRPGSTPATEEEEVERLAWSLPIVREVWQEGTVSVDTFRPAVARRAVEDWGADIINDVSGGCREMTEVVSSLHVPYVLTQPDLRRMGETLEEMRLAGVADIILDPGIGFAGGTDEDFRLLSRLPALSDELGCPVLVGVSRKSMIRNTLGVSTEEALTGTICLNTIALMKGATILRVHDVREAAQCISLCSRLT